MESAPDGRFDARPLYAAPFDARPLGSGTARPLMVTADAELLDDILRLAAAAGVDLDVVPDATAARESWARAPIVLVGDDVADAVGRARLRRRREVVVVGRDLDDAGIWRRAVHAGAEHVAVLPDAEPWLVGRLGDASDGSARCATVISVIGGRGGAGASTLAAALAVTGMRQRRSTILIDADPLGGGVDLLFGGENAAGLRWPDLVSTQGRIAANALREALPTVGGLAVLSWDRGDVVDLAPGAMASVVEAAGRACELVVIDMPRRFDEACEIALGASDVALLVVPAELRAAAAAARVAASARHFACDVRLVVRGPAPGGLEPADLADALQLPLDGSLRAEPELALALERGEVPAGRAVGPLAEYCADLLVRLGRESAPSQLSDPVGRRSL